MPGQPTGLIEYVAHINNIDLHNASRKELLYVYALTFKEIHKVLRDDIINFPEASLEEIVEAFRVIFNFFNDMQSESMDKAIAADIQIARTHLVQARSCANTAAQIIRTVEEFTIKYYELLPLYQQNLQNCAIHLVNLNNQTESWLKQNP